MWFTRLPSFRAPSPKFHRNRICGPSIKSSSQPSALPSKRISPPATPRISFPAYALIVGTTVGPEYTLPGDPISGVGVGDTDDSGMTADATISHTLMPVPELFLFSTSPSIAGSIATNSPFVQSTAFSAVLSHVSPDLPHWT